MPMSEKNESSNCESSHGRVIVVIRGQPIHGVMSNEQHGFYLKIMMMMIVISLIIVLFM